MYKRQPDDYHFDILDEPDCRGASIRDDELLGLYDGVSLPDRADGYDGDLPDVITVFKGPHERCFGSRTELVTEIGKTVVHEIGPVSYTHLSCMATPSATASARSASSTGRPARSSGSSMRPTEPAT